MRTLSTIGRSLLSTTLLAMAAALPFVVQPLSLASELPGIANGDAAQQAYSQAVASQYKTSFGADKPFLPSNATTDTGEFIDPKSVPTAAYCGHCHEESHAQWQQSAHANSFRAPWYIKNVDLLKKQKGVEATRHCEGCHNPIALTSGALTSGGPANFSHERPFDNDGVTCAVCHSIQKVTTRGTGSYVLGQPAVLVDAAGKPITHPVSDGEILAHLDRHSAAVMKPFYKTPEFCASCHKAALPRELNDYKWMRAFSVYDEWQNSSFARLSPLPFYKKDTTSTCQTCHMQREALLTRDSGAKSGTLASHRWLGANTILPKYYGFDEQARRTVEFLRNGVLNIDLFALEHTDATGERTGDLIAPLGQQPFSITPGDLLTASVVIQNKGAAHSHVPEQRDMYESWVTFSVKDAAGHVLSQSGRLKPDGELDERAHSFTNRLINKDGDLNDLHQVWNNRIVAYNNTIQSGRSQVVRYQFKVPQNLPGNANGPLTLTAAVEYRRFDQHFMDFGMGKHYEMPVVEMVSTTRTLNIGPNSPEPNPVPPQPNSSVNPLWMRWNNYGIGLLDAQQYAAAASAFEHVAKLRPDYPDAFTNIGLVDIQWQKFEEARTNLQRSLTLAPNNARALYYLALVERNEGNLDGAIADLLQVAEQFPQGRDAHRELGLTYYQLHKYTLAEAEYEKLQAIDPDDLAAHYNLSILYRRLGLKEKSAAEAAYFADQKDDPMANTVALEFFRKHPEISNESVAWHAHPLDDESTGRNVKSAADAAPAKTAAHAGNGSR
jgi:tetratricopeptide (TPR) repeat protein